MGTARNWKEDSTLTSYLKISADDTTAINEAAGQLNSDIPYIVIVPTYSYVKNTYDVIDQFKNWVGDNRVYSIQTKVRTVKTKGFVPDGHREIPINLMSIVASAAPSDTHVSTLMKQLNETGDSFIANGYSPLGFIFENSKINRLNILNLDKVKTFIFGNVENVLFKIYKYLNFSGLREPTEVFWEYYNLHATPEINFEFLKLVAARAFEKDRKNMLDDFCQNVSYRNPDFILTTFIKQGLPSIHLYAPIDCHLNDPGALYDLAISQTNDEPCNIHQRLLGSYPQIWAYLLENGHKYKYLDQHVSYQYTQIIDKRESLTTNEITICIHLIRIMLRNKNTDTTRITNLIDKLDKHIYLGLPNVGETLLAEASQYRKLPIRDLLLERLAQNATNSSAGPQKTLQYMLSDPATMRGILAIEECKRDANLLAALHGMIRNIDKTVTPSEDQIALNAEWKKFLINYESPTANALLEMLSERTPSPHSIRFFDSANAHTTQPTAEPSRSHSPRG